MSLVLTEFEHSRVILPVIHPQSVDHAAENIEVAQKSGSDGIFLFCGNGSTEQSLEDFLAVYAKIHRQYPGYFIGVNLLDWPVRWNDQNPASSLPALSDFFSRLLYLRVPAVFVENSKFIENSIEQPYIEVINQARQYSGVLLFGGVAFHDPGTHGYNLASVNAKHSMDVVMTGGVERGTPPTLSKMYSLSEPLGDHPLGISSGISPLNILDYPMAKFFSANTHIVTPGTEDLNPHLLGTMVGLVRKYLDR
ncbi:MAG: hypothetical protein Q8P92_01245 [Candidatus Daviesbacteria bacterium]|nr:hypothetical protein [Candidatus Daviesbacteria bacterium]